MFLAFLVNCGNRHNLLEQLLEYNQLCAGVVFVAVSAHLKLFACVVCYCWDVVVVSVCVVVAASVKEPKVLA